MREAKDLRGTERWTRRAGQRSPCRATMLVCPAPTPPRNISVSINHDWYDSGNRTHRPKASGTLCERLVHLLAVRALCHDAAEGIFVSAGS